MKEVYWEIKINKPGPRFLPELSLSGPAKVVYFDLPIYFLHGYDDMKLSAVVLLAVLITEYIWFGNEIKSV